MKIKPVNGHLLIEPLVHEQFIATERETYQEIGVVIDADDMLLGAATLNNTNISYGGLINKGDRVYFDSWLAAKFPNGEDSFLWLVKWEDVRAVSHETLPE